MRTLRNTEIDNTRSSLTARTKSKRRNQEFRRGLPQTKAEVQMFFCWGCGCQRDTACWWWRGWSVGMACHMAEKFTERHMESLGKACWVVEKLIGGHGWARAGPPEAIKPPDMLIWTTSPKNSFQIPGRKSPFSLNILQCSSSALYWQSKLTNEKCFRVQRQYHQ